MSRSLVSVFEDIENDLKLILSDIKANIKDSSVIHQSVIADKSVNKTRQEVEWNVPDVD
jgi:hypothetical protein